MEIWLPRNDSSPPSHRRHLPSPCVLSPSLPAQNTLLQSLHLGALMLGVLVFPCVPKSGVEAKRDLGRAAGGSGWYPRGGWALDPAALAGWLVPDTEQGSRLVRTVLGEPGSARGRSGCSQELTQTAAIPPTSIRHLVLPGEGGRGGGEAGKQGHRLPHPRALHSGRTLSQRCVHLTQGPSPEQALVWGEGRKRGLAEGCPFDARLLVEQARAVCCVGGDPLHSAGWVSDLLLGYCTQNAPDKCLGGTSLGRQNPLSGGRRK